MDFSGSIVSCNKEPSPGIFVRTFALLAKESSQRGKLADGDRNTGFTPNQQFDPETTARLVGIDGYWIRPPKGTASSRPRLIATLSGRG